MKRINVELFHVEHDYPDAVHWWKHHGWTPPHTDFLPATGWIAKEGDLKIAAVWLYTTGTKISWLEWLVANPDAGLKLRYRAMQELIRVAQSTALQCGSTAIFTSVDSKAQGLQKLYSRFGFNVTDRGATNMVARIENAGST